MADGVLGRKLGAGRDGAWWMSERILQGYLYVCFMVHSGARVKFAYVTP